MRLCELKRARRGQHHRLLPWRGCFLGATAGWLQRWGFQEEYIDVAAGGTLSKREFGELRMLRSDHSDPPPRPRRSSASLLLSAPLHRRHGSGPRGAAPSSAPPPRAPAHSPESGLPRPPHTVPPALRGNPPAAHSRGRLHGHPFVLVASTQNLQGVEEQLSRRQSLRAAQKAERRCCACVTPGPDRLQGGDQQNPREALGQPRRRRQNPSESFRERCAAAAGALRL